MKSFTSPSDIFEMSIWERTCKHHFEMGRSLHKKEGGQIRFKAFKADKSDFLTLREASARIPLVYLMCVSVVCRDAPPCFKYC